MGFFNSLYYAMSSFSGFMFEVKGMFYSCVWAQLAMLAKAGSMDSICLLSFRHAEMF